MWRRGERLRERPSLAPQATLSFQISKPDFGDDLDYVETLREDALELANCDKHLKSGRWLVLLAIMLLGVTASSWPGRTPSKTNTYSVLNPS